MRVFVVLAAIFATGAVAFARNVGEPSELYKAVSGPPEEFASHTLPDPSVNGEVSTYAMKKAGLSAAGANAGQVQWSSSIPVDGEERLTLSWVTPYYNDFSYSIVDPSGNSPKPDEVQDEALAWGSDSFPCRTWVFTNPILGNWTFTATADSGSRADRNGDDGFLIIGTHAFHVVVSSLSTIDLHVGNTIGVHTRLVDKRAGEDVRALKALGDTIDSGILDVSLPDGTEEQLPMSDDGTGLDEVANDGIWTGSLQATEEGKYTLSVDVAGETPDGTEFIRTVSTVINVLQPWAGLQQAGQAMPSTDPDFTTIIVPLNAGKNGARQPAVGEALRSFAQVWGLSSTGEEVPVAWVGGIGDLVDCGAQGACVQWLLHNDWLTRSGAVSISSLKAVWIQDLAHFVPMDSEEVIAIKQTSPSHALASPLQRVPDIHEAMLKGPMPRWVLERRQRRQQSFASNDNSNSTLLLVHGYCAAETPYSVPDFTDATVFKDFNQNRLVDEFAQGIMSVANQFDSVGILAHSQGGLASLHLHSFYWTPLENGKGDMLVTSYASPYQGVPLAGLLAKIGNLFGLLCGSNDDLTYDGAKLWLSGVPEASRKQLSYYGAHYSKKGLLHYCVLAANAILGWPNDGLVEADHLHLDGGNDMGIFVGECHSVNMHNPPISKDHNRNLYVNQHAAR